MRNVIYYTDLCNLDCRTPNSNVLSYTVIVLCEEFKTFIGSLSNGGTVPRDFEKLNTGSCVWVWDSGIRLNEAGTYMDGYVDG